MFTKSRLMTVGLTLAAIALINSFAPDAVKDTLNGSRGFFG